jgi:hypothetical protein
MPLLDITQITQGALTLVAALSWNHVAKEAIDTVYPKPEQRLIAALLYALTITTMIVLIVSMFNYANGKLDWFRTKVHFLSKTEHLSPCVRRYNHIALNDYTN